MRIIVYGDSNVQARFSKDENTFVHRLGEHLRTNGLSDVEVVNAGVIGFGPDQSLIRFENEADSYKPDLVIFLIFADNDFGDIVRNRLFELDAHDNLKKTNHRRTIDESIKTNIFHTLSGFLSSLSITKQLSLLLKTDKKEKQQKDKREETLNQLLDINAKEYSVYKESQTRAFSHFADHYDIDIALYPNHESSKTKIKLMKAILQAANIAASSKDIAFLVVIEPSVIDLTKENAVLSYEYLQQYPEYRRTNLTDAVKYICIGNNIHFVNLFEVFTSNDPENLFFRRGNDHWNDRGQDIAAKETSSYITGHMMSK